VEEVYTLLT
jgi:glycylpeptide N-tetradecanoyltransferase